MDMISVKGEIYIICIFKIKSIHVHDKGIL